MGFCSVCGNWVDEGDICRHCGSSGTYHSTDKKEDETTFDQDEYYSMQARTCSIKGDHLTAIKFYNEALKCTWINIRKCNILSAIAGEYEAIEDYDSAERYWNKCLEIVRLMGSYADPAHIAGWGDFLYRRGRFEEAIDTYEKVFEVLKAVPDNRFGLDKLKICAKSAHFIIDSYDKLGKDNPEEKYHNELKNGINKYISTERHLGDEARAHYLSEKAWKLYENDGLTDEALILFDAAIELHPNPPAEYYNTKAIMLDGKFQYEEALKYYDKALSKDKSNKTFLDNRAGCKAQCIKQKLKMKLLFKRVKPHDLELIDEALEILPESYDKSTYLSTKSEILYELGEPVKAKICAALSVKNYDQVAEAEKQLEKLKSFETYINITGIHYYHHFEPFREGTIVDLIREPDNQHDPNAIRVEISGETVGYVANSRYTLIKEVKSATDIKDSKSTRAEVQFILFNEWVIAKLI